MQLSDLDFMKLLPEFMRRDEAVKGLAAGVDVLTPRILRFLRFFSVWNKIDEMGDDDLDELAWELNVEWYDSGANIEAKRQLIRQADLVHSRLGTKWAVEQVIGAHFGAGQVREWWQYGGEPHHFKVLSDNPSITNEHVDKFLRILGIVKRKSSWLDSILVSLTGDMDIFIGMAVRDHCHEINVMGTDQIHVYNATFYHDSNQETVTIRNS
jgi:phage tail P2-like protein